MTFGQIEKYEVEAWLGPAMDQLSPAQVELFFREVSLFTDDEWLEIAQEMFPEVFPK